MKRSRGILISAGVALGVIFPGCGGQSTPAAERPAAPQVERQREMPEDDQGRCAADGPEQEVSEYDTSGDDHPDVRRVFRRLGQGALSRLVLACREADLNGDRRKDIVRLYNDEGRPIREEADRDFDGQIDEVTHFTNGRITLREIDTSGNGMIDTKIFYEAGVAVRAERDMEGRSTVATWQPDRWEYFADGRTVRVGTDLNGDGKVDRWDRDEERLRNSALAAEAAANQ